MIEDKTGFSTNFQFDFSPLSRGDADRQRGLILQAPLLRGGLILQMILIRGGLILPCQGEMPIGRGVK